MYLLMYDFNSIYLYSFLIFFLNKQLNVLQVEVDVFDEVVELHLHDYSNHYYSYYFPQILSSLALCYDEFVVIVELQWKL